MDNIIYYTTFIYLSALIDAQHLRKNHYIDNHVSRWLLRALVTIGMANSTSEILGGTFLFMALFDLVLNRLLGRDLLYLGSVAYWDRFWSKIPLLYIIMKVVCLFVGIYLCLI